MTVTLSITIIVESLVVVGYSFGRKKPLRPILFTSVFANLFTQPLLWVVLNIFFQHYLSVLLIAELLIWAAESVILYFVPANQLRFTDASFLSLIMNLSSFVLGWFLPV